MIRLFNVYYPVRTLVLLIGEALIVWTSFLLGAVYTFRQDSYLVLNYEGGYLKILVVTVVVLLCSHWFDLYDTARLTSRGELYFRLLMVPGLLAFLSVQEWPARESCPQCRKPRLVDREHCEHCGAEIPPPEKTGTEIFEPAGTAQA